MQKRDELLKNLNNEVGTVEMPAGSNKVKFNDWYHEPGTPYHRNSKPYAWCGTFVAYMLKFSGIFVDNEIHAALVYVPKAQNVLVKKGMKTTTPQPGDIVIFDWNKDGFEEHIGFFIGMEGDKALCIEGNTSPDERGSQSNGGMVCLKKRSLSLIEGFYNVIGD